MSAAAAASASSSGPVVASRVVESCVVSAPVHQVFGLLKTLDFEWWSAVQLATGSQQQHTEKDGVVLGSTRQLQFKDGVTWTLQVMAASLLDHTISFEVVGHNPAAAYSSALHTITCKRITATNQTYIQWESDFSNDAAADVLLDSAYKKKEAFASLAAHLTNGKGGASA